MKNILVMIVFMLATLAWAAAQQPGSMPDPSSGQATSSSSQAPGASQSQSSMSGADQEPGQSGAQTAPQGPPANAPITEGCLGGSNPNFTITDSAGTTYKLNIPPNADTSKLASHVGESVNVAGNVKDSAKAGSPSIDVQGIGRGMGACPAGSPKSAQPPPKQ